MIFNDKSDEKGQRRWKFGIFMMKIKREQGEQ